MNQERAKEKKTASDAVLGWRESVKELQAAEKIESALCFMKKALLETPPRLRDFWEVKETCYSLLKGELRPEKKRPLWREYQEVIEEAKSVKARLEEQALFSIEQVNLALDAMDCRLLLGKASGQKKLSVSKSIQPFLKNKIEVYAQAQQQVTFLDALIHRLSTLKGEVLQASTRSRGKTLVLDRMAALGDTLYPARKQAIDKVSALFLEDVLFYAENRFPKGEEVPISPPLFRLRDQIRGLQALSKQLTLSAKAFQAGRAQLNQLWKQVETWNKMRLADLKKKAPELQENFDIKKGEVTAFCDEIKQLSDVGEIQKKTQEMLFAIKKTELDPAKGAALREQVEQTSQKIIQANKDKIARETEKQRTRIEETLSLCETIIKNSATHQELETFVKEAPTCLKELKMSLSEAMVLKTAYFKALCSAQLPSNHQSLEQLREEVKKHVEVLRKEAGGSGFNFELAMLYDNLLDQSKAILDTVVAQLEK